jgi:hypothetical protein
MNTLLGGLWDRSLEHYPANARRSWYLALTVIATITLNYESLTRGSVAPLGQAHFQVVLQKSERNAVGVKSLCWLLSISVLKSGST